MNLNEMENEENTNTTITVAGESIEVKKSANVKDTLKKILSEKGIDSFTILVNGEEITSTTDLPSNFNGHNISVERYVKPGVR
jgi:hypothetical protein